MTGLPLLPQNAPFAPDQIAALNTVMAASNAEQRSWLSGFLAGYQAAGAAAAPGTAAAAQPQARLPLTILYATESGNAEGVAADAKKAAARQGFAAEILDMADTDLETVARARNLLVIASTWGEGDPPDRAASFYKALMAETAPRLEATRFAVLALGDSAYANFCEVGKRIDARLEELGGTRVTARVDCDVAYEEPAAAWVGGAIGELKALARGEASAGGSVIHVDFAPTPEAAPSPYGKANPFAAEITDHVNLNGSRSDKQTIHLELSLAGSGLTYQPGDALGILPVNDPATVETVLETVGLGGDDVLHTALSESHDVTTLTRPLVEGYAALTGDPALETLARSPDLPQFLEGRQIADLFAAFPHTLTRPQLTGLLRPLPPRLYSIASSLKAVPDEAHLLISAVRWQAHGRGRGGVASTYVADRLGKGDRVRAYVKPNKHFRLPADPAAPIVMIGPGTGVAPFRAFLQEREATGATGKSWLFFGDRTFTHDFLYQIEWQDHLKAGTLTRLDVAFSRDQPEKIYVQHRMWQRRAELWRWIQDGATLYVCGDEKQMARDVQAMLLRIAADRGGLDQPAAQAWLDGLRRQNRYLRDVY